MKRSKLLIAAGVLLLCAAGALLVRWRLRPDNGALVQTLEAAMPPAEAGLVAEGNGQDMPVLEVDGLDYVGILELPSRGVKLAVAGQWSASAFAWRPARWEGSAGDGSLIIGGRYERENFDFIDRLDGGEQVLFTDMAGVRYSFTVARILHSGDAAAESLRWDELGLTLFAKKDGGYLIVRCIPGAS